MMSLLRCFQRTDRFFDGEIYLIEIIACLLSGIVILFPRLTPHNFVRGGYRIMPEVVQVSCVEQSQCLTTSIAEYFKTNRFAEITQAIGMHSILVDPQHTMRDQARLYHTVLDLIKDKAKTSLGKHYSAWYVNFPKLMDELVASGVEVTDKAAIAVLASRRSAFGPFKSLDDFFFWSLEDRRLTLDQIVKYIDKTALMPCQ
jgi:hypothetical protein